MDAAATTHPNKSNSLLGNGRCVGFKNEDGARIKPESGDFAGPELTPATSPVAAPVMGRR
ncbi:hypothetical protein ACE6H2_009877 [Prunus campanulata]